MIATDQRPTIKALRPTDITPQLLRQALREVMTDTGQSKETMAGKLGMSVPDLRCWLNTPANYQTGPWIAHIDRIVELYLARVYVSATPPVQETKLELAGRT